MVQNLHQTPHWLSRNGVIAMQSRKTLREDVAFKKRHRTRLLPKFNKLAPVLSRHLSQNVSRYSSVASTGEFFQDDVARNGRALQSRWGARAIICLYDGRGTPSSQ
jgi:hypothetical protein